MLLVLVDVAVLNLASRVFKSVNILMLASLLTSLFLYYDPADLLMVWIGLFGFYRPAFSIIALLSKLPVGSFDANVWGFVFHSVQSQPLIGFAGLPSWVRYALLGGWILAPLIALPIRKRQNKKIYPAIAKHISGCSEH